MACSASGGSLVSRLARSCFMCSALVVPGKGRIPIARSTLHTICGAIDVIGREMGERTGERLRDLNGKGGCGIVGQSVVLTGLISKFCLQKKVVARDQPAAISVGQSLTDSGFEVMLPLVRRVDAPK